MVARQLQFAFFIVTAMKRDVQIAKNSGTKISLRGGLVAGFNWTIWSFIAFLVSSQFLGVFWNSIVFEESTFYGRSPVNPLSHIDGTNDEPYTDRNIVCMAQGRSYAPMQLSQVLSDERLAPVVDKSGESINGFRVCKREGMQLDSAVYDHFIRVCERIDYTLDVIQDSCDRLGFNVTRDVLRIVDDIGSKITREIPRALPILIMPFWDNGFYAHYVIPGWDGQACVFRLDGMYMVLDEPSGVMRAATRSTREEKTIEWLDRPGGTWRNGWYEDLTGQRWITDMMTTVPDNVYGIKSRQFDTLSKKEIDCSSTKASRQCRDFPIVQTWGDQCKSQDEVLKFSAVYVSTGEHYGLFVFDGVMKRTVENRYSLETFISNVSIFVLLFRWFVSMATMASSYRRGVAPWHTTGIGCLSSSRTFNVLPIMLLPRLKMTMAAFWTVGCEFEGNQRALGEAWFAVYPAIVELMLLYFSVLNGIAKVTHRRMSDALFGPTVFTFALLHRFRLALVKSGWVPFDSRIPTVVSSDEFASLNLINMFDPSVAVRLNGNIPGMVYAKLILLAINLVPLLFSENMTRSGKKYRTFAPCHVEKSLALRASNIGGLGLSQVYVVDTNEAHGPQTASVSNALHAADVLPPSPAKAMFHARVSALPSQEVVSAESSLVVPFRYASKTESSPKQDLNDPNEAGSTKATHATIPQRHSLSGYELDRLGYLVLGGKFLITFDDWYILTSLAPLRVVEKLWNHRICVFDVIHQSDGCYVSRSARLCRLDDEELRSVPVYDITLCALR